MSKKVATRILLFILGMLLLLHLLIFTEQISYDQVWGGKLDSVDEMRSFELFSILLNAFMITILFIKYKLLVRDRRNRGIDALIWTFVVFFALNTIGNLFAESMTELIFGTLLTLSSSILCFVIVRNEKTKAQQEL